MTEPNLRERDVVQRVVTVRMTENSHKAFKAAARAAKESLNTYMLEAALMRAGMMEPDYDAAERTNAEAAAGG